MSETAEHWTYAKYASLPDDGKRYEVVRGELVVCPAPNSDHQDACLALGAALRAFARNRGSGRCVIAPFDVVLAADVVLQPDVLFVTAERLHLVRKEGVFGAPDLVVEILSPSTKRHDLVVKRALYAEYGVREMWVVDPDARTISQFGLENGELRHVRDVATGEVTSLAVLPGFSTPLADLFE
jgi:Uma2 family endonuclease